MTIWIMLGITILFVILLISLTFGFLVKANKIKPSKISRLFYYDDESFIKSWEKVKEKGMLRYAIKNIISYTIMMGVMGIVFILNKLSMYGYEQSQTVFVALIMGVMFGLINSLIGWGINSDRYSKLKEKLGNGS